jgi:glutathione S-transferase
MKLFYASGSSSLLPHIVLHEAGLPFEAIKINEHTKVIETGGDYRKVNRLGYVPALVLDDGSLLTEGAAIVQYIADQVPTKKLAPPNGTIDRTRLQAWLNFFSSEMHKGGFSPLFYRGALRSVTLCKRCFSSQTHWCTCCGAGRNGANTISGRPAFLSDPNG